ncbi:uncharacterized protein LOC110637434 isoform X6 [Hevea brasiliensis]|uniref:uncharacterized protein LOC110637434 isoform X6 n=1 Tax=Hevea brasiliensis TaxID=3981 RepID=UPI0025D2FCD3|nr:uncharacterized protein LOC110637434 isoform X6 [Hevea brasiliensis]
MKVVMELQIHNEKDQQKAMKRVCAPPGKITTLHAKASIICLWTKLKERQRGQLPFYCTDCVLNTFVIDGESMMINCIESRIRV